MACVRSLALPEARLAVCAATHLRRLRIGLSIRPYVSITSVISSLCTAAAATLYLLFFSVSRVMAVANRVALAGSRLTCVVGCPVHDVGDVDVQNDGDAGVSQAGDRMSGRRLVMVPPGWVVPGISSRHWAR